MAVARTVYVANAANDWSLPVRHGETLDEQINIRFDDPVGVDVEEFLHAHGFPIGQSSDV